MTRFDVGIFKTWGKQYEKALIQDNFFHPISMLCTSVYRTCATR